MTGNSESQQAGLQRADIRQKVLQTVSRLPGRERRLLLLRELEGLSYAQIGEAMGVSPNKLAKTLHRARLRFRRTYASQTAGRESKEKCRRLGHLLSAFYDGELEGPDRQRVAEHLDECPDCRRLQDKLASTSELLGTLAPTPAPPGLADRILARAALSEISLAGAGGTIWRLPLMLLAGGGFIAGVIAVVLFLWQDSEPSSPVVLPLTATPTESPTATATATVTAGPSEPAVLTPAATPLPQETVTPTPSPSTTASPTPGATATRTPTPESSPTPTATPGPSPTPSPTAVPGPGGIQGSVTCQGQATDGAQVTATGPFPQADQVWSGVTGGDGSFSTGLILPSGSYLITIISPGASYDTVSVAVSAGAYASVAAECTLTYRPGY